MEAAAALGAFERAGGGRLEEWVPHRLDERFELLVTGIGKVNAAGGVARYLAEHVPAAVVSIGVAGVLPSARVEPLQVVAGTRSVYADEGVLTPTGFIECAAMGFPLGPFEGASIECDAGLVEELRRLADASGPIATVSTCSGTDAQARAVRDRTGALCEAMEGAAVGHVVARLAALPGSPGTRFAELRVISNTTGDRSGQRWNLRGALDKLTAVLGRARVDLTG
jgi:futalosine hydrolase